MVSCCRPNAPSPPLRHPHLDSLIVFELLRPHIDSLDVQLYRTVRCLAVLLEHRQHYRGLIILRTHNDRIFCALYRGCRSLS